ncbi:beta-ketoacyl synthase chain length factor [Campylobacter geochelonis]|uniref:beta-ketoacyl synthase chain length factor n=1 Tax=Campylobacter geochelonis TaxID=1780362 RepID=UPI00077088F6|nr:beta-ketoacyl synthase chain length factor [Campylobacter geochelonis]CZE49340.1 Uncharacterised protein [Campylobacter geochelonis]
MKFSFNILKFDAITNVEICDELKDFCVTPELNHIAPLARRRLSKCAKFSAHLLKEIDTNSVASVFSSRDGEINRCFSLLDDVAKNEPISPTSFSLSVHNATLAQIAIFSSNNSEISAISSNLSLENGLLNGYLKLEDGFEKVAVISYFEGVDNQIAKKTNLAYAVLVVIEKGSQICLEATPNTHESLAKNSDIVFLKNMLSAKKSWSVSDEVLTWRWCVEAAV